MKVLQFTKFYPPVYGGIETATFELADGLARRHIDCEVLCANVDRASRKDIFEGIPVTRSGSLAKLLSTSLSPQLVWDLLQVRNRYDVIHVHLPNPMATVALMLTQPNAAMVLHWHSDIINQAKALRLYEPMQTWMLRRADAIIATSTRYADFSPALRLYSDKVHVVPLGINLTRLPPQTPERLSAREELRRRFGPRKIVFSVGRMASYKGFDQLIEASKSLSDDAMVLVAGGGELLEKHRQHARALGIDSKVHFLGRVSDLEMAALLDEASIFCLPSTSRAEAFGMVLLEAMAAGLPIVTTDIEGSGVPWVNAHGVTGLNVAVNSPSAIAQAVNTLVEDPALAARYGAAGQARLQELFVADRMVDRTIEVYRKILHGR